MKYLGFSENAISWFKSYLSFRQFRVSVNDKLSQLGEKTCGVPQGSILGPLLFLLDLKCEILLYADDTCLVFQGKNISVIEKQLNEAFSSLCEWFVDKKLSVNFEEYKTKSILFGSKWKIKKVDALNIEYKDKKIINNINNNIKKLTT